MEEQSGPSGPFRYARYFNLPIQFSATIGVFVLAGWWADGEFGTKPWLMVTGLALGFGAGFYNLIREVYGDKKGR